MGPPFSFSTGSPTREGHSQAEELANFRSNHQLTNPAWSVAEAPPVIRSISIYQIDARIGSTPVMFEKLDTGGLLGRHQTNRTPSALRRWRIFSSRAENCSLVARRARGINLGPPESIAEPMTTSCAAASRSQIPACPNSSPLDPMKSNLPSLLPRPLGAFLLLCCFGCALADAATTFTLGPGAALKQLADGEQTLKLDAAQGGFFARDVRSEGPLNFAQGELRQDGTKMIFDSKESAGIRLHAEFQAQEGYVHVEGYLENTRKDDRAVILDYRVGLAGKNAVFSNALNAADESSVAADGTEAEGNAFPVAALQTDEQAVAMGIPGDAPCSFGMVGSNRGLATRFYLGVTPDTKAFPNRARFAVIIYPSAKGWGFRSALARYYSFYPKIYEPREKQVGYYLYMCKGVVPKNIDQYSMNVIEIHSPFLKQDLQRDTDHGLNSLLYTLVGQREIKFLPKLPANYDEAMQDFAKWTPADHAGHPVTKENAVVGADKWLKEEVESSAAKDPDGKYVLSIRDTPWGKKSVSFKVNPSPYLFQDKSTLTVGRDSTQLLKDWLKENPQLDGVIVDSLGANWPAVANYRRDHIAYAQFPVTFDPQGRLFINNDISHYEWVKYTREQVLTSAQYLSGNGVYAYQASLPEHYRMNERKNRIKLSRFFTSTFLDSGTSEAGARATTDRAQDARIMFGRKYYSLINYDWEDQTKVKQFFNRALAYDILASNTKNFSGGGEYIENVHEGVDYHGNPQGYARDKELMDWFLPKAQMLHKAGWQPVTNGRVTEGAAKTVYLERYGEGNNVYFAIFNDSGKNAEVSVKVDMPALGFTEGAADYQELAYGAELKVLEKDTFQLTLEPYHTYIVSMTKTWLWGQNPPPLKSSLQLAAVPAR